MPESEQLPIVRRVAGRGLAAATAAAASWAGLLPFPALADDSAPVAGASDGATPTTTAAQPTATPVSPAPTPTPGAPVVPVVAPATDIRPLEMAVLALVNGARADAGLPGLQWDAVMAGVAREHARDMMEHNWISHTGTDGTSPQQRLRRAGVDFQYGSENIWTYWGDVPEEGPGTMHAAMMAERYAPGLWNHVGNILYPGYRRIGVGLVTSPAGVQYLTEDFAD